MVGGNETGALGAEILIDPRYRGLCGLQSVFSDAHRKLVAAIDQTGQGAAWEVHP